MDQLTNDLDGNALMLEQVRQPNPWTKMMKTDKIMLSLKT
jgi:hypothetical protein